MIHLKRSILPFSSIITVDDKNPSLAVWSSPIYKDVPLNQPPAVPIFDDNTSTSSSGLNRESRHIRKYFRHKQRRIDSFTEFWPHRQPFPEQLAESGFFYDPTNDKPDRTQCFRCNLSLFNWSQNDDPK